MSEERAREIALEGLRQGINFSDWRAVRDFCHSWGCDVTDVCREVLRIRKRLPPKDWACDQCGCEDLRLYRCGCCGEYFCSDCEFLHSSKEPVDYDDLVGRQA